MKSDDERADLPLLKGTLDLLVLKTLSFHPLHGYGIASWLEHRSDGSLGIDDSALYQSLQRLESRGLIEGEWGVTDNNRRARYYRLTTAGRRQFRSQADAWSRYAKSVTAILAIASRSA